MLYFMTNYSHVGWISQHKQIHVGIHIYHMCNMLFNLIIMLDFLIITNILTFYVSLGAGGGTIFIKIKKYMSKNIKCNIFVVLG